jgi:glycosyltransferase involved in cell wall biosynthesis
MKVSIIVPLYGDRNQFNQIDNGIRCLEYQTNADYEVLIIDDGAHYEFIAPSHKFTYISLRPSGSPPRSPNVAFLEGFNNATGDFIITSHPEILIPNNAIDVMLSKAVMNRRNVPIQYHLSLEQIQSDKFHQILSNPDNNFDKFKELPDFWITRTPWTYANQYAITQHMHFSFCGQSKKGWMKYKEFLPYTEKWYMEDCWWHEQEKISLDYPNPIDLEIYHQWHPRCYGEINNDDVNASARIKRIRGLL